MTVVAGRGTGPAGTDPIPRRVPDPAPVPVLLAREGDLQIGEIVHLAADRKEAIFLGVTAGGRFAFARPAATRPHRFLAIAAPAAILQPGRRRRRRHARRTAHEA